VYSKEIEVFKNMSVQEHRKKAESRLKVAVLTVSDTRTFENDLGGNLIQSLIEQAGHKVVSREIVKDELEAIQQCTLRLLGDNQEASIQEAGTQGDSLDEAPDAILITGGTGLAARDQTTEAIEALYDARIPGYGELFRMLSYQEIGPASMLSRASGGRRGKQVILTMPGSPAGVQLAMEKLIVPELPHLVHHAGK
jgi:molybdenum cofactor biosynthesis protein B